MRIIFKTATYHQTLYLKQSANVHFNWNHNEKSIDKYKALTELLHMPYPLRYDWQNIPLLDIKSHRSFRLAGHDKPISRLTQMTENTALPSKWRIYIKELRFVWVRLRDVETMRYLLLTYVFLAYILLLAKTHKFSYLNTEVNYLRTKHSLPHTNTTTSLLPKIHFPITGYFASWLWKYC